jgi:hypothetical protein
MGVLGEIYFSVDVESDGPIPGPHSMLSFGAAAFTEDGTLLGTFTRNLETLPGASEHPATAAWWRGQPAAWEACRRDVVPPKRAMEEFVRWVGETCKSREPSQAVCVAAPAGYDFTFLYWYMIRFVGESPFSFSCLDVKTFVMALLRLPYRKCSKKMWPRRWFGTKRHTHIAIDDAIEQGESFVRMLNDAGD